MKNRKFWISLLAGLLAGLMLMSLLVGILPKSASAASSGEIQNQIEDLKSQKAELQEQMAQLESRLADNVTEIEAVVNQKNILDQQIALLYSQMDNINEQISSYCVLIADKQDELDAAQTRLDELSEKYRDRIRVMEEEGSLSYWAVLFKASSFSDFLDRLNMIEEIAAADQRRLDEMRQAAQVVKQAQEALETEKAALEETRLELETTEKDLDAKRIEADALLNELISRGEEYEALLARRQDEQDSILANIALKEQEYNEAKDREYQQWLSTSVPPTTQSQPNDPEPANGDEETTQPPSEETNPANSSEWLIPCDYVYISSPFSDGRMHPILGYVRPHRGIDLAAYRGTPIIASRSGTVTTATYDDECGWYVIINHGDGFSSGYLHMLNYIVTPGQQVAAGEVIGYVGTSGLSEGYHLHFSIIHNGTYVNPAEYVDFY